MSFWESELFSVALLKTIMSCVHTENRAGEGGRLDTKESLYIVGVFFFPLLKKISSRKRVKCCFSINCVPAGLSLNAVGYVEWNNLEEEGEAKITER